MRHIWLADFRAFMLGEMIGEAAMSKWTQHYILEGREIVPVEFLEWAEWFETNREARQLARDAREGVEVSTVFLGLDHSFSQEGPPIVFESMIFGGELDGEMQRYATYDEALAGHRELCARVDIADILAAEFIEV
jgi:hypothetical protein